jgi:hypothetical protein
LNVDAVITRKTIAKYGGDIALMGDK